MSSTPQVTTLYFDGYNEGCFDVHTHNKSTVDNTTYPTWMFIPMYKECSMWEICDTIPSKCFNIEFCSRMNRFARRQTYFSKFKVCLIRFNNLLTCFIIIQCFEASCLQQQDCAIYPQHTLGFPKLFLVGLATNCPSYLP